jgi:hypothetical protein
VKVSEECFVREEKERMNAKKLSPMTWKTDEGFAQGIVSTTLPKVSFESSVDEQLRLYLLTPHSNVRIIPIDMPGYWV